jgi:hypothetical protein
MNRDRYISLCKQTASGNDSFVRNTDNGEQGLVESCTHESLLVKTSEGKERIWDFHKCEEAGSSK